MQNENEIAWTPEQVARFWDYQSKRPSASGNYFSISHGRQIAKRTLRFISRGLKKPRILDLGCGTGHFILQVAQLKPGALLHGIDFSGESIAVARETTKTVRPEPVLQLTSGYPTPLQGDSFDAIFSIEVIEHLSDEVLEAMMSDVYRLLKKGGMLAITTPNREDLELLHTSCPECGATFHIWQHVRSWSTASLIEFMTKRGFRNVSTTETLLEPWLARLFFWSARKLRLVRRRPPHIVGIYRK